MDKETIYGFQMVDPRPDELKESMNLIVTGLERELEIQSRPHNVLINKVNNFMWDKIGMDIKGFALLSSYFTFVALVSGL